MNWIPLASFLVSFLTLLVLLSGRVGRLALDLPNHRSLHGSPVPRVGGLAVMTGLLVAAILLPTGLPLLLWGASAAVFAVSLLDDLLKNGLPVVVRLLTHLGAASAAVLALVDANAMFLFFLVLAVVWAANLFNFMDGSDGLAGGMALIGFGAYAVSAWLAGDTPMALLCLSVSAACLAFLLFNFHPARVFMGDAGSVPLGFLAAAMGLAGWQRDLWPGWMPLLVFSPFVVDATFTLARRGLRGERVWEAHREHYYQRLVQLGLGHRGTALAEYVVMAAAGASAVWGMHQQWTVQVIMLAVWCALFVALMAGVDVAWVRMRSKKNAAV